MADRLAAEAARGTAPASVDGSNLSHAVAGRATDPATAGGSNLSHWILALAAVALDGFTIKPPVTGPQNVTVWDGAQELAATVAVWDGAAEVAAGSVEVHGMSAPATVSVGASTTGYVVGTSFAVTLPEGWDAAGAKVLLFVQRNDSQLAMTADSGVTLTEVTTSSMQRVFEVVDPAASFTVTVPSSNHNRWVAVVLENASAVKGVAAALLEERANSTTSVIEGVYLGHGFTATGDEVVIAAGGTNSTAVWTGPAGWTEVYATPSGNASIGVWWDRPAAGSEGTTVPDMDRGNDGSARNESQTLVVVS